MDKTLQKLNTFAKGKDYGMRDKDGKKVCVGDTIVPVSQLDNKTLLGSYEKSYSVGKFTPNFQLIEFKFLRNEVRIDLPYNYIKDKVKHE